jgi:acyl-CoA thioester hydrolase
VTLTTPAFTVRYVVRSYETDANGHLNGSVYVQYADEARRACAEAAGVSMDELFASGVGPVNLETTIRFHRELRAGDEVDVSCAFEWGGGKTIRVVQEFRRPDGSVAAELVSVGGLLDLVHRKLVPDPCDRWRSVAAVPAVLGL